LVVDSTGLKIYGEGEWLDAKRRSRSCRRWRKLHIGVNVETLDVVVAELTPDDVGDVSTVPDLLEQIDSSIGSLIADGAYDVEAVYNAVAERHPGAAVIIPPRATAVANEAATSQRDRHIATIAQHGRIGCPISPNRRYRDLPRQPLILRDGTDDNARQSLSTACGGRTSCTGHFARSVRSFGPYRFRRCQGDLGTAAPHPERTPNRKGWNGWDVMGWPIR
jgi:hypothetical protein